MKTRNKKSERMQYCGQGQQKQLPAALFETVYLSYSNSSGNDVKIKLRNKNNLNRSYD